MSIRAVPALRWPASALVLLFASGAWAQEAATAPGHRDGFWATLGGGYAVARSTCSECREDPPYRNRPGFYLQLGGVASRHLLVAGEIFTESGEVSGNSARVNHFSANAQWYPWSPPVYIKLGFGVSRGKNTFEVDGVETKEVRTGLGIVIGLGTDIRLGRALSLSPTASWYMAAVGDFKTSFGIASSVSANTWFVGMGLTLN